MSSSDFRHLHKQLPVAVPRKGVHTKMWRRNGRQGKPTTPKCGEGTAAKEKTDFSSENREIFGVKTI